MNVGVFDLFKVGIGPSSSHTTGPMLAAGRFIDLLGDHDLLGRTGHVTVDLFGSLGATGRGHGTVGGLVLGLGGARPESVDPGVVGPTVDAVRTTGTLTLGGCHTVPFDLDGDLRFRTDRRSEAHPNGMVFRATDAAGAEVAERTYFSIGGGFVLERGATEPIGDNASPVPYPFATAAELLGHAERTGLPISTLVLANEVVDRPEHQVRTGILDLWRVMQECVRSGCAHEGVLPGGLAVPRRAPDLMKQLAGAPDLTDPMRAMEWVTAYALAVNEENAAGGRVVTAPTNGAAGIVPAVLHFYRRFVDGADEDGVVRFLLTATAVGALFKQNASLSGAEVGCQGEVGAACSMAAAGLAEVLGGTPGQVENAAEIGIEHNLGLTCDPVGGLVQIPCIERNAMGAIEAIAAARMALLGTGRHHVSLDQAIETMRQTGADMQDKYKETSRGGLALNVVEC
ncbi:MAG TPA: L-serine ammonia-lyase [Acidimicrobiales bacterium]